MVSRLPVFSGKKVGTRVPPDLVLPVFIGVVLFIAVLIAYPWIVLTTGTLIYLACLPLGWLSYREYVRRDAATVSAAKGGKPADKPADNKAPDTEPVPLSRPPLGGPDERPTRH
jgi:CDP-diacylglycerol--serine O-phosphatidyltransferase